MQTYAEILEKCLYQFGCGISMMVGPKMQDFYPKNHCILWIQWMTKSMPRWSKGKIPLSQLKGPQLKLWCLQSYSWFGISSKTQQYLGHRRLTTTSVVFSWCLLEMNAIWHEIRQSIIYYAGLLGRWDKRIVDQESDVPSIISFYTFYRLRALKFL